MKYYVTTIWIILVQAKCMHYPWAVQAEHSGYYYQQFSLSPPLVCFYSSRRA